MTDAPAPPPPAIERPVSYQASYGVVQGTAPRGARRLLVRVDGTVVCEMPLRRRSFQVDVALPPREVRVRIETVDARGRRSGRTVGHVLGLPPAARPAERSLRLDPALEREVTRLSVAFPGSAAVYVQDLATGAGAAWNARATFPAASTLKAAIAVTLLGHVDGPPAPGSRLDDLLWRMLIPSDNEAANTLLVRLGGSTSGGGALVDTELRTIGLERTEMYGGYILGTAYGVAERDLATRGGVPLTVVSQPQWGVGKATTALDLARLYRAIWLASGGLGPLIRNGSGVSPAEARYLLYLLSRVGDRGKLARTLGGSGLLVMHKAGWIDDARHDAGLVVWRGGIFFAATMTYRSSDAGTASDVFAGRVAAAALRHVRG